MPSASHDLDAEFVFDRFLSDEDLVAIQHVIVDAAPKWSSKLRVWRDRTDQTPVDTSEDDALARAVRAAAGERGETYRAHVEQYGPPPFERLVGSAELRGAGPELTVIISLDELVVSPLGEKRQLGNDVSIQVRRPKVESRPGADWLLACFEAMCARLSPAWGAAYHPSEYESKVMSDEPPFRAVGRDFGRNLPGVFWLNFFGSRLREMLGEQRLLSVPVESNALDNGVLVALGSDPRRWDEPEYAALEQQVRDHLGSELFFTKADPERPGKVPDWM
jgi:hypothetical protein